SPTPKTIGIAVVAALAAWAAADSAMRVTKPRLFDQLVGLQQKCFGDGEADRLGRLHIHHQQIFGRELHWQLAHLGATQNPVDIGGGAAMLVDKISPISEQATFGGEGTLSKHCRQAMLGREFNNRCTLGNKWRRQDQQAAIRLSCESVDRTDKLDAVAERHLDHLYR